MSRRRPAPHGRLTRAAAAAAGLAVLAGCASEPDTLRPRYVDSGPSAAPSARAVAAVGACPLAVTGIIDGRHVRDALGSVGGRTVLPPPDQDAWLRSVIQGLAARGLALDLAPSEPAKGLSARFTLETAWVTSVSTNKVANVVWRVEVTRPGAPPTSKDYRGTISNVNWVSGDAELRSLVDRAFSQALDAMATDLRSACPSP